MLQGKTGETQKKTYSDSGSPPLNPHGVTETRNRDPCGKRRQSFACAIKSPIFKYIKQIKLLIRIIFF